MHRAPLSFRALMGTAIMISHCKKIVVVRGARVYPHTGVPLVKEHTATNQSPLNLCAYRSFINSACSALFIRSVSSIGPR